MNPTSDERREAAARLRNEGRALTALDVDAETAFLTIDNAIGIAHNVTWENCFNRLADFIEPPNCEKRQDTPDIERIADELDRIVEGKSGRARDVMEDMARIHELCAMLRKAEGAEHGD